MVEKDIDLKDFINWMEILIAEHSTLEDFKESMIILIDNFKKEPTYESYHELEAHVMLQVMRSFYTSEFSKSIDDLIID